MTMVGDNEPTPDLRRELFARFGLAYYQSDCLHRELCNFLAIVTFESPDGITRPRVEEKLAQAYSLSLGQVVEALRIHLPSDLFGKLELAVEKRNFLAHHFWFERAHLMITASGHDQMIEELDSLSEEFHRLDEEASALHRPIQKSLGVTDEQVQAALEEYLAGKPGEPLPKKRRPKKQERIVRAWELQMSGGASSLIFESEDGCLWQLCDVGLGWTHHDEVRPDWQFNSTINQYLPATFNPRPKEAQHWNYEFPLAKGAVLWVKLGSRQKTFRWGIRSESKRKSNGVTHT